MIVEFSVAIKIEIGNHAVEVFGFKFAETIFSLELTESLAVDESDVCSVNAFESSVGFKFANCTEDLS